MNSDRARGPTGHAGAADQPGPARHARPVEHAGPRDTPIARHARDADHPGLPSPRDNRSHGPQLTPDSRFGPATPLFGTGPETRRSSKGVRGTAGPPDTTLRARPTPGLAGHSNPRARRSRQGPRDTPGLRVMPVRGSTGRAGPVGHAEPAGRAGPRARGSCRGPRSRVHVPVSDAEARVPSGRPRPSQRRGLSPRCSRARSPGARRPGPPGSRTPGRRCGPAGGRRRCGRSPPCPGRRSSGRGR